MCGLCALLTIPLTALAVHSPIVVAMIVYGSLAIKEQAVLTGLQGQSAVCAEKKLITIFRMRIRLFSVFLRTLG